MKISFSFILHAKNHFTPVFIKHIQFKIFFKTYLKKNYSYKCYDNDKSCRRKHRKPLSRTWTVVRVVNRKDSYNIAVLRVYACHAF